METAQPWVLRSSFRPSPARPQATLRETGTKLCACSVLVLLLQGTPDARAPHFIPESHFLMDFLQIVICGVGTLSQHL